MFSKITSTPRILHKMACGEEQFSSMETKHLPNGMVLFLGLKAVKHNQYSTNSTLLTTYLPAETEQIAKLEIRGHYCFGGSLCDNSFLLYRLGSNEPPLKVFSKTLEWEIIDKKGKILPIGNQQYITLFAKKVEHKVQYRLHLRDLKDHTIRQPLSLPFFTKGIPTLKQLENGQIVCECFDANSPNKLFIILFERNQNRVLQLEETGRMVLKSGSKLFGLQNGRLLTYHPDDNFFQVWDKSSSVEKCNYRKTKNPGLSKELHPFPDANHVILNNGFGYRLCNISTKSCKFIDFGEYYVKNFQICANGYTLIAAEKKSKPYLLIVDFKEIKDYREALTATFITKYLYLNFLFSEQSQNIALTRAIICFLTRGYEALLSTKESREEELIPLLSSRS